jgi:hypothetical protein
MELIGTEIKQFSGKKYECKICDYTTERKSNYDTHNLSAKHKKLANGNEIKQKLSNKFECEICDKFYQTSAGLWKHKQKCNTNTNQETIDPSQSNEIEELKEFMKYLMKENSEMKNMMMKVIENGTHNITTNSHNKSFNLNFFLNETCKDAMNIMDFVDSIKLQLSDLEKVGEIGYVAGISNIIVKNLKELDVTQRPVHCTDKKRETLYVKDENKWEKDDEKKKLRKVIKRVASKNQRLLLKFKEVHPDCNTSSSKYSDQYNTIIVESMGGSGDNDLEKEEKIMRTILKQIVVDKEN